MQSTGASPEFIVAQLLNRTYNIVLAKASKKFEKELMMK